MRKQYFTLIICALLFCSASVLAQVGNTKENPIFAGNFSSRFTCPNTQNTAISFTNNYTDSGKSIQTKDVYYKFTLMKAMEITISHCGSALSNTSLYLLDASGNKMASNHGASTSISGCTSSGHAYLKMVLPAATYYIVSEGYSQNGEIKTTISGVASEFDYTAFPDTQSSSSKAVGSIAGAFDVSPSGAATYSIPIEVPPGVNGMQPNIAITYNSQAGNGVEGYGANIAGISAITRVPRSIYYDGTAKGITHDNDDIYALDGQRLIYVSGIESPTGAIYNTESEPFTTITCKGDYFEVLTKDGTKYTYGYTSDSRQTYSNPSKTNAWYLNEVVDVMGNYMTYEYYTVNYFVYLRTIKYGKNKNQSNTLDNTITFTYGNRIDAIRFKIENYNGWLAGYLTKITTKTGDDIFREYNFSYDEYTDHFSRLASVSVKNGANETLNPTTLGWSPLPNFSQTAKTPTASFVLNRGNYSSYSKFTISNKDSLCEVRLDIFDSKKRQKIIHSETIYVPLSFLDQFNSFFSVEEDTITNNHLGLDGTIIFGKYENNDTVKYFDFWSPLKNTKEYILLINSIDYLRSEMKTKESKKYLRGLKGLLR